MQQKTPIAVIMLVLTILASYSGCLGGGKTGNETTSPLANSLLTVSPVEAMIGNTATLSCVLNTSNGQGLVDQTVYWLSLIHISEPRDGLLSRMPSSA